MVYKTVALRPETYERLRSLGTTKDTLGDVVERLIDKCGDQI